MFAPTRSTTAPNSRLARPNSWPMATTVGASVPRACSSSLPAPRERRVPPGLLSPGNVHLGQEVDLWRELRPEQSEFGGGLGTHGEIAVCGTAPNTYNCSLDITRFNGSYMGQARYALTNHVNLLGEYTHMRSESQARAISTSDSFALGTVAFF